MIQQHGMLGTDGPVVHGVVPSGVATVTDPLPAVGVSNAPSRAAAAQGAAAFAVTVRTLSTVPSPSKSVGLRV